MIKLSFKKTHLFPNQEKNITSLERLLRRHSAPCERVNVRKMKAVVPPLRQGSKDRQPHPCRALCVLSCSLGLPNPLIPHSAETRAGFSFRIFAAPDEPERWHAWLPGVCDRACPLWVFAVCRNYL